jgi:homoserine kinase type II
VNPALTQPPDRVRAHFAPHTEGLTWRRAPAGFSGARVWCGARAAAPQLALKEWPVGTEPDRLQQIHAWLIRAEHLPFIPGVIPGVGGATLCISDGRVWDCCRWVVGEPRADPSGAELAAACAAVARLHAVWAAGSSRRSPCPGVRNRLRILAENDPLLRAGPGALAPVDPILDPLLRRAVEVCRPRAARAARALQPWAQRALVLHPCVRDLRGEHVLFAGAHVGGVIDFGAAAVDHAAVDLARLLGDFAPVHGDRFAAGVGAYRSARPAFDAPDEFVRVLADTGAVCSVLGWLVRFVVNREPVSGAASGAARLARLLEHVEANPGFC